MSRRVYFSPLVEEVQFETESTTNQPGAADVGRELFPASENGKLHDENTRWASAPPIGGLSLLQLLLGISYGNSGPETEVNHVFPSLSSEEQLACMEIMKQSTATE